LGADHPAVATSLNNLASLYCAIGRYGEAEPLYLRALGILVKALPENHPHIKGGFSNFRGMVQAALEAGQADQLSDHPTTQTVLQQLRRSPEKDIPIFSERARLSRALSEKMGISFLRNLPRSQQNWQNED